MRQHTINAAGNLLCIPAPGLGEFELQRIGDNILTYLGRFPKELEKDPEAVSYLLLNLGKLLLWISPDLDGKTHPQISQPRSETAETVYALGEQFRELGLELAAARERRKLLHGSDLDKRLASLEKLVAAAMCQNGTVLPSGLSKNLAEVRQ